MNSISCCSNSYSKLQIKIEVVLFSESTIFGAIALIDF